MSISDSLQSLKIYGKLILSVAGFLKRYKAHGYQWLTQKDKSYDCYD